PHQRLHRLVELSCETLARTSPVHAVLRGAADGHPFAAELCTRMLGIRLRIQARNLQTYLGTSLRPGLSVEQAAERYSPLLSPELYHLLTVGHRWATPRYASWVRDLLHHDLLGCPPAFVSIPQQGACRVMACHLGSPASRSCLRVSRLAATALLTLEAARGATSRSGPEADSRSTTLVRRVPWSVGASR